MFVAWPETYTGQSNSSLLDLHSSEAILHGRLSLECTKEPVCDPVNLAEFPALSKSSPTEFISIPSGRQNCDVIEPLSEVAVNASLCKKKRMKRRKKNMSLLVETAAFDSVKSNSLTSALHDCGVGDEDELIHSNMTKMKRDKKREIHSKITTKSIQEDEGFSDEVIVSNAKLLHSTTLSSPASSSVLVDGTNCDLVHKIHNVCVNNTQLIKRSEKFDHLEECNSKLPGKYCVQIKQNPNGRDLDCPRRSYCMNSTSTSSSVPTPKHIGPECKSMTKTENRILSRDQVDGSDDVADTEDAEMEGTDLLHMISHSLDRFNAIVHPTDMNCISNLTSGFGGSRCSPNDENEACFTTVQSIVSHNTLLNTNQIHYCKDQTDLTNPIKVSANYRGCCYRLSLDTQNFNVLQNQHTSSTTRANLYKSADHSVDYLGLKCNEVDYSPGGTLTSLPPTLSFPQPSEQQQESSKYLCNVTSIPSGYNDKYQQCGSFYPSTNRLKPNQVPSSLRPHVLEIPSSSSPSSSPQCLSPSSQPPLSSAYHQRHLPSLFDHTMLCGTKYCNNSLPISVGHNVLSRLDDSNTNKLMDISSNLKSIQDSIAKLSVESETNYNDFHLHEQQQLLLPSNPQEHYMNMSIQPNNNNKLTTINKSLTDMERETAPVLDRGAGGDNGLEIDNYHHNHPHQFYSHYTDFVVNNNINDRCSTDCENYVLPSTESVQSHWCNMNWKEQQQHSLPLHSSAVIQNRNGNPNLIAKPTRSHDGCGAVDRLVCTDIHLPNHKDSDHDSQQQQYYHHHHHHQKPVEPTLLSDPFIYVNDHLSLIKQLPTESNCYRLLDKSNNITTATTTTYISGSSNSSGGVINIPTSNDSPDCVNTNGMITKQSHSSRGKSYSMSTSSLSISTKPQTTSTTSSFQQTYAHVGRVSTLSDIRCTRQQYQKNKHPSSFNHVLTQPSQQTQFTNQVNRPTDQSSESFKQLPMNVSQKNDSSNKPIIAKSRRACSFYLRGHCKKEDCEFAHDLTKVTCKFWEMGECFKGTTCPFLHGYPTDDLLQLIE